MAVLNSWQRIDRVLPGKPWGNGANGAGTISGSISNGVNWHGACSGTAGNTTLTVPNGWIWTGLGLVHQTQGTGAGQWEIVYINSISGTTATLNKTLQYSYGTGAQCVLFQQFTTATVNASNVLAWNGSSGGIAVICAKDSITVSGAINGVGGFLGAVRHPVPPTDTPGTQGEGTAGARGGTSVNANGNGGGAGQWASGNKGTSGGGGGGNANAGTTAPTAYQNGGSSPGGTGGNAVGSTDLITMDLGGGGGSGACNASGYGGAGGMGGGIVILISKAITVNDGISTNGVIGENGKTNGAGGGGGAGGSILVVCETATLGTNNATAAAGGAGTGSDQTTAPNGGAGSVGRIAVHYSTSVSGTTNPTYTGINDTSLKEAGATGNFIPFFM